MRMVKLFILVAAAGLASPAFADVSPSLALGQGEMILKVSASGKDTRQADRISVGCILAGTGDNKAETTKSLAERRAKMIAALKPLGLKEVDIKPLPDWMSTIGNLRGAMAAAVDEEDADEPPAQEEYLLRIPGVEKVAAFTTALDDSKCIRSAAPEFKISDAAEAQAIATNLALKAARAKADSYAESLGLRVIRAVRLDEGGGILGDLLGPEFQNAMSRSPFAGASRSKENPGQVETTKSVTVEYLLGPK